MDHAGILTLRFMDRLKPFGSMPFPDQLTNGFDGKNDLSEASFCRVLGGGRGRRHGCVLGAKILGKILDESVDLIRGNIRAAIDHGLHGLFPVVKVLMRFRQVGKLVAGLAIFSGDGFPLTFRQLRCGSRRAGRCRVRRHGGRRSRSCRRIPRGTGRFWTKVGREILRQYIDFVIRNARATIYHGVNRIFPVVQIFVSFCQICQLVAHLAILGGNGLAFAFGKLHGLRRGRRCRWGRTLSGILSRNRTQRGGRKRIDGLNLVAR